MFIVFDLDGVIFRGQYLLRLSRKQGLLRYLYAYYLCILFDLGRLTLEELLEQVYAGLKGMSLDTLWKAYEEIPLIKGAREAIQSLKKNGHTVIIISSGVPDFMVRDLALKLGADMGFGIDVKFSVDSGAKTTTSTTALLGIGGELATSTGKCSLIQELIRQRGIGWESVVAIGDDPNNIPIMEKAGLSIGINASFAVRKKADYLVDGNDLRMILKYIDINDCEEANPKKEWLHQEVKRKLVHMWAGAVPFLANIAYIPTIIFLLLLTFFYALSEIGRLNGRPLPILSSITLACMRKEEGRRLVFGPITMAIGVVLSLLLFPPQIALLSIWILAFADTAATLIGKSWKGRPIPYNPSKSIVGSMAFCLVAFLCSAFYLAPGSAFCVAVASAIFESLPFKDDNISMPLGAGAVLMLFAG